MRYLWLIGSLVAAAPGASLRSQTPNPTPLNWWEADSARVAFVTSHGRPLRFPQVTLWSPTDSLDPAWLPPFADSLSQALAALRALVGGPHAWQRIGTRPVVYIFSPGRFISHATGHDTVFIALARLREGQAPVLHEAAHELLAPIGPFNPDEYADSAEQVRRTGAFPDWLVEGLPDYLAQAVAAQTGFPEGDIFAIGGLARVDSSCAARLSANPWRREIEAAIGQQGRVEALFTTDREVVAPTYYACSQSLTKFLVDRIGVGAVVALFPAIPAGSWMEDLEKAAGVPLPVLRERWLSTLRLSTR